MNGGHLGFVQYGAHGGSPTWLPRKINSICPWLQVVQIWCLWIDLNNSGVNMDQLPDYEGNHCKCKQIVSFTALQHWYKMQPYNPWTQSSKCAFWYKLTKFGTGTRYNTLCDIFRRGTKTLLHKRPNLHKFKMVPI